MLYRLFLSCCFIFLLAGVTTGQVFTFSCHCEQLTGADCDICNTTVLSRHFKGLLIRKNGVAYKWIDEPYTVRKLQGENVLIIEQIPTPDQITIARFQTGFSTVNGFIDSIQCACTTEGTFYTAGPGIIISDGQISAVDTSTTNELQAISASGAGPTSYNLDLSLGGGSVTFSEGANINLTRSGNNINIAATGLTTGTVTSVAATAPAAGFTISGSPITTSGNLTFTLADDLAALEGITGTGIAVRTASNTWTTRTLAAGTGISIADPSGVGGNPTITNTGDLSTTNEIQTYAHSGTTTYTNTLSIGGGSWSITGAGIAAISQTAGAITVTATEVDGLTTNEGSLTVGAGTGTTSIINSNTSGSTGVTVTAGTGLSIAETGNVITLTNTSPDQTVAITGAGINVVTGTYPNFTITGTEVDALLTNEGSLTVGAGTGTTSIINSNTSGSTGVTITAGTGLSISETGNVITLANTAPDQTVSITGAGIAAVTGTYPNFTVTATEVDGSTTNEIQTVSAGGAGPNYTIDLSLSGGTVTLAPGANISLSRSTNTITVAATGLTSGTVTSFSSGDLSPLFTTTEATVTTTPALSFSLNTQTANTVFAGPTSGGVAAPTFRTLVAADLPTASVSKWTDAGAYTYLTSTTDRALVGSSTELNTAYTLQASGGAFIRGAGATSGTYTAQFHNSSGTNNALVIRDDGLVGIGVASPAYQLDVNGDISVGGNKAFRDGSRKIAYYAGFNNFYFGNAGNLTGTGDKNVAIGEAAFGVNTTGNLSVAIGANALSRNTTGSQNFALGTNTLQKNVSGIANIGVGNYVLVENLGSYNVGIGDQALTSLSSGTGNIAIGGLSSYSLITGGANVTIGNESFLNADNSSSNVIIGDATFRGGSGSNNVIIGRESFYSTNGSNNIGIGRNVGASLSSGNNNILIGYNVNAFLPTGSNQMTIGNIIFSRGIDGTGTTYSSGSIGIKENNPQRTLHVAGEVRITDLTTDAPTRFVGADGDGDLNEIIVGTGLTLSAGTISVTNALPSGADTQTLRFTGPTLVSNSEITNNGNEVGIGGAPLSGFELYTNGATRTDGTIVSRGAGNVVSGLTAAGLRLWNPTVSTGDTWYASSQDDGTFLLQSGNGGSALTISTSTPNVSITNRLKIGTYGGTATAIIAKDASGFVADVTLGTGLSITSGTLNVTAATIPSGTTNQTLRYSATNVLAATSALTNDNTNVSVGGTLTNARLTVAGLTAGRTAQFDGGAMSITNTVLNVIGTTTTQAYGVDVNMSGTGANVTNRLRNSSTTNSASNAIQNVSVASSSAGDPFTQYQIEGVVTWATGLHNADGDKYKITPNSSTPGGVADKGIIVTNTDPPFVGINKDAPAYPLDVNGRARAALFFNTSGVPTIAYNVGAGTGPTTLSLVGGSNSFTFSFTTGTLPTANAVIFTATLPQAYSTQTIPTWSAISTTANADYNKFRCSGQTFNTFTMQAVGTLAASTTYTFTYHTGGY